MHGLDTKTWIVTGASGGVGRMLMRQWARQPLAGVRFVPQYRDPSTDGILWDMLEGPDALSAWIALHGRVDGLLVLSGATPDKSADMQLNVALVQAAIRAAKTAGIPRVLYASSSAVYGNWSDEPYLETAPLRPVNAYGRSKVEAEIICRDASNAGLEITCLRIGNVAGADALLRGDLVLPVKLDQFAGGQGPTRSYIGPQTLADIIVALMRAVDVPPVVNVAAPQPVSMQGLLEAAGLAWHFVPAGAGATQSVLLNTDLISSFYTFQPNAGDAAEIIGEWRALRNAG